MTGCQSERCAVVELGFSREPKVTKAKLWNGFEEPVDATAALICISVFLITSLILWFGRKRLVTSIPCALVFLFLAAFITPSVPSGRSASQRAACIMNLKAIQAAKVEWAKQTETAVTNIPAPEDLWHEQVHSYCAGMSARRQIHDWCSESAAKLQPST
jgi:hypothetical protein